MSDEMVCIDYSRLESVYGPLAESIRRLVDLSIRTEADPAAVAQAKAERAPIPFREGGELAIVDGASKPGDYVEMQARMDLLCAISNCPQVNNPCNGFHPTPIRLLIWNA